MKKSKLMVVVLVLVFCTFGLIAVSSAEQYKICGIVPMSGPVAQYGDYWLRGAMIAVDDLNKEGNNTIAVMTEDNQLDPKLSIVGVRRVNMMKDVLMLGTTGSSVVLAMAPLVADLKIPVVNVGGTSPKIRGAAAGWMFSNTPSMDSEGKQAAIATIRNLKAKTAAVLYVNNEYGLGGRQMFSKAFEKEGGKIVAAESHEIGSTDFRTQWAKIKAAKPDVVYLADHDVEGGRALKQKSEMGITIQVIGSVSTSTPQMIKAAGSASEGYIGMMSNQDVLRMAKEPKIMAYEEKYIAKFGEPFQYQSVNAYDSVMMLAAAIESGATTRSAVRDYLASKIKNYDGLGGVYSFDKDGQFDGKMGFCKIEGGEFTALDW